MGCTVLFGSDNTVCHKEDFLDFVYSMVCVYCGASLFVAYVGT